MQFFIDSQGTVVNLISSPVYQGSTNACELVLVAPFSSANVITAYFKLPNGITTAERIMSVQAQPMLIEGMTFNVWRMLLDGAITEYSGKVTVQFSIYQGNPNGNLPIKPTAYAGTFVVQTGVTPMPTDPPPTTDGYNIYQAILQYLSQINPQFDIESISYSTPNNMDLISDDNVSTVEGIPDNSIVAVNPNILFTPENVGGTPDKHFFACGDYYNYDTGFTLNFATPLEIGKVQIEFTGIYDSVLLKVIADRGLETERLVTSFRVQSVSPVNTIIAVNDTVNSLSVIQPWTENVSYDTHYSAIVDKGYTKFRYLVNSIKMYAPNTVGQITITSSTGRTIVFPDTDAEAYAKFAQNASEQAQGYAQNASDSATNAQNALNEINSKAGQEGGYPVLEMIGGQPKIPSVYINLVNTTTFITIENESELDALDAPVGSVARLVTDIDDIVVDGETVENIGTKTVTKSFVKLQEGTGASNWALYASSYADNASNALYAEQATNALRVNNLNINGILSEAEYNALASKQGVYFVSIEGE